MRTWRVGSRSAWRPTATSRDPLDHVRHRRFRYRNPEHVLYGLRPFGPARRRAPAGMRAGGGAGQARALLDVGVDALRKRPFRDRAAIAAERTDPVFRDLELRFRPVVDLPRGPALRFGALRKLLEAAMAGIRDVIDDAVRILRPTRRRPRMSGLAAGPALRLAAQTETRFLFFSSGGGFANPSLDGGLPLLPENRLELRSSSPIRCFKATINSRNFRFSSAAAAFSAACAASSPGPKRTRRSCSGACSSTP